MVTFFTAISTNTILIITVFTIHIANITVTIRYKIMNTFFTASITIVVPVGSVVLALAHRFPTVIAGMLAVRLYVFAHAVFTALVADMVFAVRIHAIGNTFFSANIASVVVIVAVYARRNIFLSANIASVVIIGAVYARRNIFFTANVAVMVGIVVCAFAHRFITIIAGMLAVRLYVLTHTLFTALVANVVEISVFTYANYK